MEKNSYGKYILLMISLFLIGYVVSPLMFLLASGILQSRGTAVDQHMLLLPPYILAIILFIPVCRLLKPDIKSLLASGKGRFRGRLFIMALSLMLIFQLVSLFLPFQEKIRNTESTRVLLLNAVVSLASIPFQTLFEELLFRILPLRMAGGGKIRKDAGALAAIIISSALFAMMHMGNPEVSKYGYVLALYYFLSGAALGIFMMLSDGVEISWAYHIAVNLYSSVISSTEGGVFQDRTFFVTGSNHAVLKSFIFLILSSILMLFLIHRMRKNDLFQL